MNQVGKKIKGLVVTLTILGLISCVILFFVGNAAYQEDKSYLKYATVYGGGQGYAILQEAGDNAYNGLQLRNLSVILAVSLACGWLPLYGFGVLVENSEAQCEERAKQTAILSQIKAEQASTQRDVLAIRTELQRYFSADKN